MIRKRGGVCAAAEIHRYRAAGDDAVPHLRHRAFRDAGTQVGHAAERDAPVPAMTSYRPEKKDLVTPFLVGDAFLFFLFISPRCALYDPEREITITITRQ